MPLSRLVPFARLVLLARRVLFARLTLLARLTPPVRLDLARLTLIVLLARRLDANIAATALWQN